jgi:peptidoglycan/xylan/chitin deacetylase (PgdA/CDA1 family)
MAGISFHLRAAACVLSIFVMIGCGVPSVPPPPSPVALSVDGAAQNVLPGTTLGELVHGLGLHAEPGRLLSVTGTVLDPHLERGRIRVNGAVVPRQTILVAGDAVTVVDGVDSVEDTKRVATMLPGMHPAVPQRTLATYPLKQIDTVGRISGEIASTEFQTIGKGHVPGEVALTFDDGPWPVQTKRVLRVLKRYKVHATFFMVGNLVDRYPGIVQDVLRAGMPIGDHSWDHPIDPPFADLAAHRLQTEVQDTLVALQQAGVNPYLFRPPGGSYDDDVLREVRQDGMRTVTWDVDPQDYIGTKTKKEIASAVLTHVRPGSIVLMHDGGGDQSATINALPTIIKGIRKMGLRLVAIPRDG